MLKLPRVHLSSGSLYPLPRRPVDDSAIQNHPSPGETEQAEIISSDRNCQRLKAQELLSDNGRRLQLESSDHSPYRICVLFMNFAGVPSPTPMSEMEHTLLDGPFLSWIKHDL